MSNHRGIEVSKNRCQFVHKVGVFQRYSVWISPEFCVTVESLSAKIGFIVDTASTETGDARARRCSEGFGTCRNR